MMYPVQTGRTRRRLLLTLAAPLLITAPAPAAAYGNEEIDAKLDVLQQQIASSAPRFSVNGYFTFAGSVTDQRDGTYDRVSSDRWDLESLSRGALQIDFKINDDTRFVTQLLSRGDQGWQTHAEWAFLAHRVSEDLTVRAGRLRIPMFLFAETQDVGYTQPWVKPPAEIYTLQFSSYEGIDLRYGFEGAGADWTVQPFVGVARLDSWEGEGAVSRGDNIHGLDITANWENVTARAGYFSAGTSIPDFPLANLAYSINSGIRDAAADGAASGAASGAAIGAASAAASAAATGACAGAGYFTLTDCPASVYTPTYNTVYDTTYSSTYDTVYDATYGSVAAGLPDPDLSVTNKNARFWTVSLRYDDGKLMLLTEYLGSKFDGYFTDTTSCYGTFGYRFGRLMPHVTWAHSRVDDPEERDFSSVAWDQDGPGPAPAFDNPAGTFISSVFALDQRSWTVGVRYDLAPGIALKTEATRVGDFAAGSSGQWAPDGTTPAPDELWVYRASVDMAF